VDKQNNAIKAMNRKLSTDYKDYLDYLEANIGDDAEFTMAELMGILRRGLHKKLPSTTR